MPFSLHTVGAQAKQRNHGAFFAADLLHTDGVQGAEVVVAVLERD